MTYKDATHELDEVAELIRKTPAETPVRAPWAPGMSWLPSGKVDVLLTQAHNLLGLTKNEQGDYRLYYGRRNVGKHRYRVWGAFKSLFVAVAIGAFLGTWFTPGKGVGIYNLYSLLLSLLGVYLFSGRAAFVFRENPLYHTILRSRHVGSLAVAALMTVACASIALGSGMRLWEMGFNWGDILSKPIQPGLRQDVPLYAYLMPVIPLVVGALILWPVAYVFDMCVFYLTSRGTARDLLPTAGVPQELYEASNYNQAAAGSGGVVMFGALFLFAGAAGLFVAY
ncbi:hypothetical protein D3C78_463800 [compost metagenome]